MQMKKLTLILVVGTISLSGCAATPCCNRQPVMAPYALTPQPAPPKTDPSTQTVRVSAIGYGATSSFEGYTPGQKRLMAMRASKLDAYRALAEQIYGVRIRGNSTVSAMVAQNDSYRVYIDSYVRGAQIVSITPMAEGNYETVLELELGNEFFNRSNKNLYVN